MADAIILFTYLGSGAVRRDCFLCARRKGIRSETISITASGFSLRAQEGDSS